MSHCRLHAINRIAREFGLPLSHVLEHCYGMTTAEILREYLRMKV